MLDGETKREIQQEIKKQINVILSGKAGENTSQTEAIEELFPGMSTINERPVMHPYGYYSRATEGKIQVTGKQGEHFGNRIVLGHRDNLRSDDIERGESVIYASDGTTILRRINMKLDKIQIGSNSSDEPLVLGNVMLDFAKQWLEAWLNAPNIAITPVGPAYLEPSIRSTFVQLIEEFITNIETNIVSQENFTERKNEGGN